MKYSQWLFISVVAVGALLSNGLAAVRVLDFGGPLATVEEAGYAVLSLINSFASLDVDAKKSPADAWEKRITQDSKKYVKGLAIRKNSIKSKRADKSTDWLSAEEVKNFMAGHLTLGPLAQAGSLAVINDISKSLDADLATQIATLRDGFVALALNISDDSARPRWVAAVVIDQGGTREIVLADPAGDGSIFTPDLQDNIARLLGSVSAPGRSTATGDAAKSSTGGASADMTGKADSEDSSSTGAPAGAGSPAKKAKRRRFADIDSSSPERTDAAAVEIQRVVRGHAARTRAKKQEAAKTIMERLKTWFAQQRGALGGRSKVDSLAAGETAPELVASVGLTNEGNTCYQNSVVQALWATPALRRSVWDRLHEAASADKPTDLVSSLSVVGTLLGEPDTVETAGLATQLWERCDFAPGAQQDAHEFLTRLMERFLDDRVLRFYLPNKKAKYDRRSELDTVKIIEKLECHACKRQRTGATKFDWQLQLPLTEGKGRFWIESLLRAYNAKTVVDEVDCPACGNKGKHSKHVDIEYTPQNNFIVLQIGRFSYDHAGVKRSNPVIFDESGIVSIGGKRFKVTAVVLHEGRSLATGHYWTVTPWGILNDATARADAGSAYRELMRTGQLSGAQGYLYFCQALTSGADYVAGFFDASASAAPASGESADALHDESASGGGRAGGA